MALVSYGVYDSLFQVLDEGMLFVVEYTWSNMGGRNLLRGPTNNFLRILVQCCQQSARLLHIRIPLSMRSKGKGASTKYD